MAFEPNSRYNCRAALVLGLLQIVLGILVFALQIPHYTHELLAGYGHVGIWAGLMFIVSGILAVISCKINSSCMIGSVMAVSIVTSIVALSGLIVAALYLILFNIPSRQAYAGDDTYKYKFQTDLGVSQIVFCILEGILAIVMSAYCCAAVCCGRDQVV